jgi:hypothetical protein
LSTLRQLRELQVDHFDVGAAVVSSLVSIARDPTPDLARWQPLIDRLWRAAMLTYLSTKRALARQRPDRVYVFNGRFAASRAVLRACQAAGTECWIHERGCDQDHFQLFPNHLPHDIDFMQKRMRAAWQAAENDPRRTTVAASWFTDRVQRVERAWHSFVKDQTPGKLPANWDPRRRNIALFTSSEDEFVSIGECWRNRLYSDQTSALRKIIADLGEPDERLHLYVRLHPNLKNVDNETVRAQRQLSGPNCTIIMPEDSLDTYQLLRSCDVAVTFGSSVGIEAIYWDRPSVLLGPCFYRGFQSVYEPQSHTEAMELLRRDLPPAPDKTEALMYGYWFATHGLPFRYFQATGLFEGKFRGQVVYDRTVRKPWNRLRERMSRWIRQPAIESMGNTDHVAESQSRGSTL